MAPMQHHHNDHFGDQLSGELGVDAMDELRLAFNRISESAMARFKRRILVEVERGCPSCHTPLSVVPVVVSYKLR